MSQGVGERLFNIVSSEKSPPRESPNRGQRAASSSGPGTAVSAARQRRIAPGTPRAEPSNVRVATASRSTTYLLRALPTQYQATRSAVNRPQQPACDANSRAVGAQARPTPTSGCPCPAPQSPQGDFVAAAFSRDFSPTASPLPPRDLEPHPNNRTPEYPSVEPPHSEDRIVRPLYPATHGNASKISATRTRKPGRTSPPSRKSAPRSSRTSPSCL